MLHSKKPQRLGVFLALTALLVTAQPAFAKKAQNSLYERLGGVYAIASVVDDFIDLVVANGTLNANPAIDAARKRVPLAGLKYQVTAFVAQAAGGSQVYIGRNMVDSHKDLNITQREWDALVGDLVSVLYKYNVPDAEQKELLTLVESIKGEIVTARSN